MNSIHKRIKEVRKEEREANFLRVCMSCEWIYKGLKLPCPKCTWPSYSARYVYGNKAYRNAKTQKLWLEKKLFEYEMKLRREIKDEKITMKD